MNALNKLTPGLEALTQPVISRISSSWPVAWADARLSLGRQHPEAVKKTPPDCNSKEEIYGIQFF